MRNVGVSFVSNGQTLKTDSMLCFSCSSRRTTMKSHSFLFPKLLLMACLVTSTFAQKTPDSETEFTRARHLRHGINASEWFAQSTDYSPKRLNSYTTHRDLELIKQMGFDHVRLSI